MTLRELYRYACERLAAVPVDAPAHEALLLCEHFLGISGRLDITISGDSVPGEDAAARFCAALEQRAARPLQYILGEWDFCSMTLAVGEGVLVPRDDTAVLVDAVCEYLSERGSSGEKAQVIDLCAGSGAVILAIKRRMAHTQCRCVELSDEAMVYLKKNVERYGSEVEIIMADVLEGPQAIEGTFDVICSNPPYIPAAEIEELGREVRQEPRMALDGGEDGLEFYRAIGEKWSKSLNPGGYLAVEVGAGQAEQVGEIFARCGLTDIRTRCDINGIERVVSGVRR